MRLHMFRKITEVILCPSEGNNVNVLLLVTGLVISWLRSYMWVLNFFPVSYCFLGENIWGYSNIQFPLKILCTNLASIGGSCLQQLLLFCCLPNGNFVLLLFFQHLLIGILQEGKRRPFSLIYLFNLYQYGLVDIYIILWVIIQ